MGRTVAAHHRDNLDEKAIEDFVTWPSVSAPTITRFSRAIGCDGLRDLELKVMSSMRVGMRYLEPVTPPEAGPRDRRPRAAA